MAVPQGAAGARGGSELTARAAAQPVGGHGLVALDWHNGNRSPLVDAELSGVIVGQTLATRPEDTYRALLEEASAVYDQLYAEYRTLTDYFGRHGNDVMHNLRAIRRKALSRP